MDIILIASLLVIAYAFIGYPLILTILVSLFKKDILKKESENLSVSLIIAAYNEADVIADKLINSLSLDYPREKLEIIVASDGSTDGTDEIVKSFFEKGIKLNRVDGRKGKTEAQNQTVNVANGDIIIFSDANAIYRTDAIKKIVRNFNDTSVGGVCGRLVYQESNKNRNESESTYWNLESFTKEKEGSLSSVIGANGSIYAVRRNCYVPLPYSVISDFVEPLKIIENGKRFIYEKEAQSYEEIETVSGALGYQRKVRINVRTIIGIIETKRLLNPFRFGWVSFQYLSHKVIRYIVPFLMIVVFALNGLLLKHALWQIMFILQLLFYSLALTGYIRRENKSQYIFISLPWHFVMAHIAIIHAFLLVIKGEKRTTWDTKRG